MIKESQTDRLAGRITPRQVIEAYEATGYEPTSGEWFTRSIDSCEVGMACALTALAGQKESIKGGRFLPELCTTGTEMESYIMDSLSNLSQEYKLDFTYGFDGEKPFHKETLGYRDGQRAAWFVFGDS